MSHKYVLGIMKKLGIKPKYIRHRTITTVSRNFSSELKNILHRHFNPEKPDAFWCTDITYIWTYDDGFVYLASVMDLYSSKNVGWYVTRTMDANVVLECIEMAKRRRGIQKGHRRNGQEPFKEGNAMGQCVHRIMAFTSQEGVHKIMNYHEAKSIIFSYIEGFYNTVRIHSHCEYQLPDEYEEEYYEKEVNNIMASNEIVEVVA